MAGRWGSVGDQGHARDAHALRPPNCDRGDIDVQPAEQRRHAGEHTWLIFHVGDKCVLHTYLSLSLWPMSALGVRSSSTSGFPEGRRIISCRAAPGTIIGYTVSSCSTRKLIRNGPLWVRAASTTLITSERVLTAAARMPNASASLTKSGERHGEHS